MKNSKQDRSSTETGKKDKHPAKPKKQVRSGESLNQDPGEDPEKRIQIDDNPEGTKRKIPNMN
jgi:hypothetical protein